MGPCPACRDALASFELGGIEIDRCLECGGTWLDAGELEHLLELAGAERGSFLRALEPGAGGRKTERQCPRCARRLRAVEIAGEPPIDIDRCVRGHGLWLDRGEMESVIAALHQGDGGAVSCFFGELYHHEVNEKGRVG